MSEKVSWMVVPVNEKPVGRRITKVESRPGGPAHFRTEQEAIEEAIDQLTDLKSDLDARIQMLSRRWGELEARAEGEW